MSLNKNLPLKVVAFAAAFLFAPLPFLHSATYTETIVDNSAAFTGSANSLAVDSSSNPHISYYDTTNGYLKYAKRVAGVWTTQTIDAGPRTGYYTALALNASDYPRIAYTDYNNTRLKYAEFNGSTWAITTVDYPGVGYNPSIVISTNGYALISYYDVFNRDLKYASFTGTTWFISTVDSGNLGLPNSIALDSQGLPHIAYRDNQNSRVKYASFSGSTWTIITIDGAGCVLNTGGLAIDSSDNAHISFRGCLTTGSQEAAWTGSTWTITTVDAAGVAGSISIGPGKKPHISYTAGGYLMHARWTGTTWSTATVASVGVYGSNSIVVDGNGNPSFTYNTDNGSVLTSDLRYASGSSATSSSSTSQETPEQGTLKAVDNVFDPSKGESASVQFTLNNDGRTVIRIYTIKGRLVKTLYDSVVAANTSYSVNWDGKNESGENVASGIYIAHIEGPRFTKNQKIAVVR